MRHRRLERDHRLPGLSFQHHLALRLARSATRRAAERAGAALGTWCSAGLVVTMLVGVVGVTGCDDGGRDIEPVTVPQAAEPAAILDFIDNRVYTGDGWRAETPEPRPRDTEVSPHARVQVFQNEILINGRDQTPYPPDSMAVKVMYEGDAVVGHAVLWQVPDTPSLTWFCYGPTNRCGYAEQSHPREEPVFGTGASVVCGQCHGGLVFTEIAP